MTATLAQLVEKLSLMPALPKIDPNKITINIDDLADVLDGYGHEITGDDQDESYERLKALMDANYDRYFPEPSE